jgi:hypothetical protein
VGEGFGLQGLVYYPKERNDMKKKMLRRLNLSRETLQRLDEPALQSAAGGGTAGSSCCSGITAPQPTVGDACGATAGHGPQQQ